VFIDGHSLFTINHSFFVATKPPSSLEGKLDTIMLLGGFNTHSFHRDIGLPNRKFSFLFKI